MLQGYSMVPWKEHEKLFNMTKIFLTFAYGRIEKFHLTKKQKLFLIWVVPIRAAFADREKIINVWPVVVAVAVVVAGEVAAARAEVVAVVVAPARVEVAAVVVATMVMVLVSSLTLYRPSNHGKKKMRRYFELLPPFY